MSSADHTLYDPGLRAALRAVQHMPPTLRPERIDQLDREAVRKGYRRPPNDMSLLLNELNTKAVQS